MAPGELLELTVDHTAAVEDVPRSVENGGHEMLRVQRNQDDDWTIKVPKGEHE